MLHVKEKERFKLPDVQPDAYKAIMALERYLSTSDIERKHWELLKIRASQINGCAYCLDMHTRDARKHGETEQRLYVLSAWREAGNLFTEEECLLLQMTEEITLIHQHGLSEDVYERAVATWGEVGTAQLITAIITINVWNRVAVSLHMQPKN